MSEPPVNADADGIRAVPRRPALNLLDLVIGGSAIGISLLSLAVAISHGRTMDRLVKSNSWPFLELDNSNFDFTTKERTIALTIKNVGVGPARLEEFVVKYDGKPMSGWRDLLRNCCVPEGQPIPKSSEEFFDEFGHVGSATVAPRVIPGRDEFKFFIWPHQDNVAAAWHLLDVRRFKLTYQGCYCSVFDECWLSPLDGTTPHAVDDCGGIRDEKYGE